MDGRAEVVGGGRSRKYSAQNAGAQPGEPGGPEDGEKRNTERQLRRPDEGSEGRTRQNGCYGSGEGGAVSERPGPDSGRKLRDGSRSRRRG